MRLKIKKLLKKIKRWRLVSGAVVIVVLALAWQGKQMVMTAKTMWQASLTNQTQLIEKTWPKFYQAWHKFNPSFFKILPELIGLGEKKTVRYTILLQNDKELRATGGFMGSLAQVEWVKGGLKNIKIEDIYVADGTIQGHIEPPTAIQQAFQQGTWRLPNSNWSPDFAQSAQTINWFLQKGGIPKSDLLVAINFTVLQDIFKLLQPISLGDYQTTITAENLYLVTQAAAETDFFPGSTQKKDFLNQLSKNLLFQAEALNFKQMVKIAQVILKHLGQKNVQIYAENKTLQAWINKMGWDGRLKSPNLDQDYLLLVDTNLGANKANCCVERRAEQIIKNQDGFFEEKLIIEYTNQSPSKDPQPPEDWGGDYKNYLRLYLPQKAKINEVKVDGQVLADGVLSIEPEPQWELQRLGFFVEVAHGTGKKVEIDYTLPKQKEQKKYQLLLQKQSGLSYEHQLQYENKGKVKRKEVWVEKDQLLKF